jgi:hypothetical protein
MGKVMMTIATPGPSPSMEDIKQQFNLDDDEIDADFGVVEIDPDAHLYTVLVEEQASTKIQPTPEWKTTGPYANPRIAPFGPPEASEG